MIIEIALEEHRKNKQEIIDDMKACIVYTPDKENDLLCLMEQYLKAEKEVRPRLLEQIKRCMDGKEYDNPFLAYYCYSENDIEKFNLILDNCIDHIKEYYKNSAEAEHILQSVVVELNKLNRSCREQLIDSYRREKLILFLEEAGKIVKCEGVKGIINEHRTW
jgi:hypothetical protein